MFAVMSLLIPGVIAVRVDTCLIRNKKVNYIYMLTNYFIYTFLINIITSLMVVIFFKRLNNLIFWINSSIVSFIRYSMIAILVAVALSLIKCVVIKNVGVELETVDKKDNK